MEDVAAIDVEELVREVSDLAALPTAYVRIRELVADPDSSMADVAQVITNDPALTTRILRIANSAYMGLVTKVDTIQRAVQVLGMNQVHHLALATSAIGALNKIQNPVLDMLDFWRRSIYAAVFARIVAEDVGFKPAERLFVCGLLHDIGHLVLAARLPKVLQPLMEQALLTQRPLHALERELLGFDYADVGAALMRRWQLPDALLAPVALHTRPSPDAEREALQGGSIIHLAAVISRATMWRDNNDEAAPEISAVALQSTGLTNLEVEGFLAAADEQVVEAYELLLPRSGKSSESAAPKRAVAG